MSEQTEPFKLTVPTADIVDLRERLTRTRFPDQAPGPAWAYGTDVAWMRELIDYWRDTFDWRIQEVRGSTPSLNTKCVHDIDLHFVHVEDKDMIRARCCYRTAGPARFSNFSVDPEAHRPEPIRW